MGYNATEANVNFMLEKLEEAINQFKWKFPDISYKILKINFKLARKLCMTTNLMGLVDSIWFSLIQIIDSIRPDCRNRIFEDSFQKIKVCKTNSSHRILIFCDF